MDLSTFLYLHDRAFYLYPFLQSFIISTKSSTKQKKKFVLPPCPFVTLNQQTSGICALSNIMSGLNQMTPQKFVRPTVCLRIAQSYKLCRQNVLLWHRNYGIQFVKDFIGIGHIFKKFNQRKHMTIHTQIHAAWFSQKFKFFLAKQNFVFGSVYQMRNGRLTRSIG
jgi:hypothetical protein